MYESGGGVRSWVKSFFILAIALGVTSILAKAIGEDAAGRLFLGVLLFYFVGRPIVAFVSGFINALRGK